MTKTIHDLLFKSFNNHEVCLPVKRDKSFDLIKGLAVFFMMIVHILGTYSTQAVQYSGFGYVIDFLGGPPAAPVFMFSMGVFYILSSKSNSLKAGLIRGLKLLTLGYLLNFLRSGVPTIVESGFTDFSINSLFSIWEIDILQFAGIAYMLMSIIAFTCKKPIYWLAVALVVMFVSPLLWGISSNILSVDLLLNFIWGVTDTVYFPIFAWLVYPLVGMVTGVFIKHYTHTEKLHKGFLKVGLPLFIAGAAISLTNLDFHIGDYFTSGFGSILWITGFILLWLWLSKIIVQRYKDSKVIKVLCFWSKEITFIYCLHWILIGWAGLIIGYECLGFYTTLLAMVSLVALTHFITTARAKVFNKKSVIAT